MLNQGGESTTVLDPSSMKGVDANQTHHSWSSSTGLVTNAGNSYVKNDGQCENTTFANHSHQYNTQNPTIASQSGVDSVSQTSTSSNYTVPNVSQQYTNYPSYPPTTEPYSYTNTQNQSYYNYQQPSVTDPSSQQAGNVQNSGTPYQPYQNPGSYVAPPNPSSVGYSSGDHQTSTYANQNSYWNGGNYGSYPQQYSTYPSTVDNSNQVTSYTASNSIHYPQYNQWSYYYPPAPNVSCAPGTENTQATSGTPTYPVPAGSIYSYPTNQPPPPGTTSWRNESVSSESSFLQDKHNATQYNPYNYSAVAAPAPAQTPVPASQTPQFNQLPIYYQTPTNPPPTPPVKYENQQMNMQTVPPTSQTSSANNAPQNFQSPAHLLETNRVSKIQIPTNPKIATNLAIGMPKEDKNRSTTNSTSKPAYIGIQVHTPSNEVSSHDYTGATKGSLPPSFRTYVERTFSRCKDDSQRAANQKYLKEVITKGSADGTLFTKNWDIEPLFPLLNSMIDEASQNVQTPVKIQTRRTKSRWEPMTEDKFAEKLAAANYDMTKSAVKMGDSKQPGSNDIIWNGLKSLPTQQQTPSSDIAHQPVKKPRYNAMSNAIQNGEASNGSDKEQGSTKYYSSASALADSPEEKKRREHRSKRFERTQQSEIKPYRPKISENRFTRMSRGTPLFKSFEVNENRAVEDIDWDAHTVRGTCQEVEKRYLRLTSAPDPATVRPEEILEQALLMVQASQKNYLYKCDQLKSIRQDLTVQRIHNELTVKVYETHARLALEAGDLPEYNQCQSQLKSLYAEGISGCQTEFSAYNMLCITLHSNNKRDLLSAMSRLSIEAKKDDAVKHAFAVRSAVSSGNYIRFFRLYKSAPNLNTSLMDLYVEKMRYDAVKCICKSYRPTIPVSYISHNLGFSTESQAMDGEDKDSSGFNECEEWLKAHGAVLLVDSTGELNVDAKATGPCLYMPEPDDAVAHGDANLAVNDFLTRVTA